MRFYIIFSKKWFFTFEKQLSIGLKSGLYGTLKMQGISKSFSIAYTNLDLCTERLSRNTAIFFLTLSLLSTLMYSRNLPMFTDFGNTIFVWNAEQKSNIRKAHRLYWNAEVVVLGWILHLLIGGTSEHGLIEVDDFISTRA